MRLWDRMNRWPKGRQLFSFMIGRKIPYSGSIGAQVEELGQGRAVVVMDERRSVQNHLGSAHAVALMNLCELSSGLALHSLIPTDYRAILLRFEIEFIKKARGKLTAKSEYRGQFTNTNTKPEANFDEKIEVNVANATGEVVCRAYALWRVGQKTPQK